MVGFSCSVLSCRDVFCPESIIRVSPVSSPSLPRILFEQRADYWFCSCLVGLQAESGGGHPLDMTQRSKWVPSSTLSAWPRLSSCLQVLCKSWEMVTAELIGRHFIISSWWLTAGLSFSNSLISLFVKVHNVCGVYLKYAVVTRIKLFTALLITGWVTWQKQEWKGVSCRTQCVLSWLIGGEE